MQAKRLFNQCLLRPADFKACQPDLEVIGAFNPGAITTDKGVVILVRVAEQARERRRGQTALPRWDAESRKIVIDWENDNELTAVDMRVVRRKRDGLVRLTFISHLRVVHSGDGRSIDSVDGAWFEPANEYEEFGVEDPRSEIMSTVETAVPAEHRDIQTILDELAVLDAEADRLDAELEGIFENLGYLWRRKADESSA